MSEPVRRDGPKVISHVPGDADQQVEFILIAGALAIPFIYGGWVAATGYPYVPGAWLFAEGLWLMTVLLCLAAWDLGAWLSGARPLRNPIAALVAPRWVMELLSRRWRATLRGFFDRYIHLVTLLIGLAIGHLYWH